MQRKFPRKIKRIVIKVGSSIIATHEMYPSEDRLKALVKQIVRLMESGHEIILVSSGAIVLGMGQLKKKARSSDLAQIQATAAVGQTKLMDTYTEYFGGWNKLCAQLLLTWDDFDNRTRYNNASNTLKALLEMDIVPVVNENDTISTDEIKFGDNDRLAAMVASMVKADLLLILSDVEGLYDLNDDEKRIFHEIKEISKEIEGLAGGSVNKQVSKGGMSAKLEAIKVASKANIPCVIASGRTDNVIERVLAGERVGTFFVEHEEKLLAKKHWISFGAKPKGTLLIDDGAKEALLKGGKSLLLPGVRGIAGHFKKEDVVVIKDREGVEIARGIVNYSSAELERIEDKKGKPEVIHVDDLVFSVKR
jgi:glutamate 5-kinase